jgi:putative toxin-antitoxin system antitoxin component (TIGR02293 family)
MTVLAKYESKLNKELTAFLKSKKISGQNQVTYKEFLEDKMLIIVAIRAGIPYTIFDLIQHYTPFTDNEWASFLDVSTKSLQRYKAASKHHFKPIHSEKIIEMAEVTKVGLEFFGEMEQLRLWLNTPNYALGNMKPIELLKDSYGKEMVIAEITRMSHGIFV